MRNLRKLVLTLNLATSRNQIYSKQSLLEFAEFPFKEHVLGF